MWTADIKYFRKSRSVSPSLSRRHGVMTTSSNGNILRVTSHLCGEFTGPRWISGKRPVTRSFNVLVDLRLNKRLSKQSRGWWFETLSHPLWRHCNGINNDNTGAIFMRGIFNYLFFSVPWIDMKYLSITPNYRGSVKNINHTMCSLCALYVHCGLVSKMFYGNKVNIHIQCCAGNKIPQL